jgi:hypothetical protein
VAARAEGATCRRPTRPRARLESTLAG